jgi:hypothetical protein
MRLQKSDDDGAGLQLSYLLDRERSDRDQHVRLREDRGRTTRPFAFLVQGVRELRAHARALFENDASARGDELVDDLRDESDASFSGRALLERTDGYRHLADSAGPCVGRPVAGEPRRLLFPC